MAIRSSCLVRLMGSSPLRSSVQLLARPDSRSALPGHFSSFDSGPTAVRTFASALFRSFLWMIRYVGGCVWRGLFGPSLFCCTGPPAAVWLRDSFGSVLGTGEPQGLPLHGDQMATNAALMRELVAMRRPEVGWQPRGQYVLIADSPYPISLDTVFQNVCSYSGRVWGSCERADVRRLAWRI